MQWQSTLAGEYFIANIGPDGTVTIVQRGNALGNTANSSQIAVQTLPLGDNLLEIVVVANGRVGRQSVPITVKPSVGGGSSGGSSGGTVLTGTPASLTPTLPTYASAYFGDHDVAKRTLSFATDADSVDCSHDNGATFVACDSPTTLLFTLADYTSAATLQVRAHKAGAPDTIYDWTPATNNPGLHFYACDAVVSSDEDYDALNARLSGDNVVVCFDANVNIHSVGTDATVALGHKGMRLLGIEGARANFQALDGHTIFQCSSGIDSPTGGGPSLVLAHVSGISNGADTLDPDNFGGDVVLSDIYLAVKASFSYVIYAVVSTPATSLTIEDSTLDGSLVDPLPATQLTANQTLVIDAKTSADFVLNLTRSTLLSSAGAALLQYKGSTTVSASTLRRNSSNSNTGESVFPVLDVHGGFIAVQGNSQLSSVQSVISFNRADCTSNGGSNTCASGLSMNIGATILSTHQDGIYVNALTGSQVTLDFTQLTIERLDPATAGYGLNIAGGASSPPTIAEQAPKTVFCQVSAAPTFTLLNGTIQSGTSFSSAAHGVTPCP